MIETAYRKFVICNAINIPFPDKQVDVIYCKYQHYDDFDILLIMNGYGYYSLLKVTFSNNLVINTREYTMGDLLDFYALSKHDTIKTFYYQEKDNVIGRINLTTLQNKRSIQMYKEILNLKTTKIQKYLIVLQKPYKLKVLSELTMKLIHQITIFQYCPLKQKKLLFNQKNIILKIKNNVYFFTNKKLNYTITNDQEQIVNEKQYIYNNRFFIMNNYDELKQNYYFSIYYKQQKLLRKFYHQEFHQMKQKVIINYKNIYHIIKVGEQLHIAKYQIAKGTFITLNQQDYEYIQEISYLKLEKELKSYEQFILVQKPQLAYGQQL